MLLRWVGLYSAPVLIDYSCSSWPHQCCILYVYSVQGCEMLARLFALSRVAVVHARLAKLSLLHFVLFTV